MKLQQYIMKIGKVKLLHSLHYGFLNNIPSTRKITCNKRRISHVHNFSDEVTGGSCEYSRAIILYVN